MCINMIFFSFSPPMSPSFLEIADDEENDFDEEEIEKSDNEEILRPVKKESSKNNPFLDDDDDDYNHMDYTETEQSTDWLQKLQTCPKTSSEIIQAQWIIINHMKVRYFHIILAEF